MRRTLVALMLACGAVASAPAQVSVGIGVNLPGVSIGINVPSYPQLVRVPDYPVYYAPGVNGNFFFYDGLYWVYEGDNWYQSSWYNGPWVVVDPGYVPLYVLRVPVRYYRQQPSYFRGWRPDAPPRWGDHWGGDWSRQHSGWDRWNRGAAPAPAPLPIYQRQYAGNRYPPVERQRELQNQNYRYQPRDAVVKRVQANAPAVARPPAAPSERPAPPREQRPAPGQAAPHEQGQSARPAPPREQRPAPGQATPREQGQQTQAPARSVPPPPRGHEDAQRPDRSPERQPQGRAAPAPQSVPHATAPQVPPHATAQQAPPHAAPPRPEPPAERPAPNRPAQAAQPPHENPGRGQGQGQEKGQEKDRGEGRGQDKKN